MYYLEEYVYLYVYNLYEIYFRIFYNNILYFVMFLYSEVCKDQPYEYLKDNLIFITFLILVFVFYTDEIFNLLIRFLYETLPIYKFLFLNKHTLNNLLPF